MLSFITLDVRLVKNMFLKRQVRAMPLAYLTTRYVMTIGIFGLAWITIPIVSSNHAHGESALHWLRSIALPLVFTSTSAILGFRAMILHFERPRLISYTIWTLLVSEFVGSVTVFYLAADARFSAQQEASSISIPISISPVWICVPLVIALIIDLIFTLIVVVPILHADNPRGDVLRMLLSDATFFGVFSIMVKVIAVALTVQFANKGGNPYLPIRMQTAASAIFACRIFRSQESFLSSWSERKAQPSLALVELEQTDAVAEARGKKADDPERRGESVDGQEERNHLAEGAQEKQEEVDKEKKGGPMVTTQECVSEATLNHRCDDNQADHRI